MLAIRYAYSWFLTCKIDDIYTYDYYLQLLNNDKFIVRYVITPKSEVNNHIHIFIQLDILKKDTYFNKYNCLSCTPVVNISKTFDYVGVSYE